MSRIPGPEYHDPFRRNVPARTPGTLGINDTADPGRHSDSGDTPGPLGHNDHAARIHAGTHHTKRSHHAHLSHKAVFHRVSAAALRRELKRSARLAQGDSQSNIVDPQRSPLYWTNTIDPEGPPLHWEDREGLVAQIFFGTDEKTLDLDDKGPLREVYGPYEALLLKSPPGRALKTTFHIVGYADHRGAEAHNVTLSQERAEAVAEYFAPLRASSMFSIRKSGRGAAEHPQATSSTDGSVSKQLNYFRRVDVFARPVLAKARPRTIMDPPPAFSRRWALRLILAAGYTNELSEVVKKIEERTSKEIAKKLAKQLIERIEKHIPNLAIGWNYIVVEIVDRTNLVGMMYSISGFSLAVGYDVTISAGPGEWSTTETSKAIQIKDFAGRGRHTGAIAGLVKSVNVDYLQLYGPRSQGADSVYVAFWSRGFEGSWRHPGIGAAADTEPWCSVDALEGPYPITPDYVASEEDEHE